MTKKKAQNYIIKLDEAGYYRGDKPYQYVDKNIASKLTHKDARLIRDKLKRLGYKSVIEKIEG
jgi:hypothetical protein